MPRRAKSAASRSHDSRRPGRQRTNPEVGDELGAAELGRRVAESLREFRRSRRLSLDELSARSGVSRAALSQIEGARTNPTLSVLGKHVTFKVKWASCPRSTPVSQGCTGAETYAWRDPGARTIVDRRESIRVSWYATGGHFDFRSTGVEESDPDESFTENGWVAPDSRDDMTIWLVIRDDRGGVGWQTYQVAVR